MTPPSSWGETPKRNGWSGTEKVLVALIVLVVIGVGAVLYARGQVDQILANVGNSLGDSGPASAEPAVADEAPAAWTADLCSALTYMRAAAAKVHDMDLNAPLDSQDKVVKAAITTMTRARSAVDAMSDWPKGHSVVAYLDSAVDLLTDGLTLYRQAIERVDASLLTGATTKINAANQRLDRLSDAETQAGVYSPCM